MSTDTIKNEALESAVKSVINTLQDGQKGYADLGEHFKDETLKRYFLAESLKRANFRGELENELHRHGVRDVHEEGTLEGTLLRGWQELKEKVADVSDHSLLVTAERAEDAAKKTYAEALNEELPLPLRQLLTEQYLHVQSFHDFVKLNRDSTK